MNTSVNTGMPHRASTEQKNSVSVLFMTPALQKAFVALNINPIEPGGYDAIRRYVAPSDLAFNFVLDKLLRQHLLFSDSVSNPALVECLTPVSAEYVSERFNLLNPLMGSQELQQEVVGYLNGGEAVPSISVPDQMLGYDFSVCGTTLLVGVEQDFLTYFKDQDSLMNFYRNGLELCQASIPGADLRGTALFAKFVKLSISL